jgi:hypothetical protein
MIGLEVSSYPNVCFHANDFYHVDQNRYIGIKIDVLEG